MAGESKSYPKKYWWVVLVVLPVVIALITVFPQLIGRPGGANPAGGNVSVVGDNNIVNIVDQMTVINNISVIAQEYQKYTGQALSDELKQLIEQAVAAASKNDHATSVRLYEQVASKVPVPTIYNNLGVEYAKANDVPASVRALNQAIEKDPANQAARKNLALIAPAGGTRIAFASGDGVRTESSAAPAILIEPLAAGFAPFEGIHVVDAGAGSSGGSYSIKYQPKPGAPVLVAPQAYDVLARTGGGGLFLLAGNVNVKEGTLARIDPNALVGAIDVRPLTRTGFPEIKQLLFVGRSAGNSRPIHQGTDTLGVTLPIAPGAYDVVVKTDDGQADLVRNFEIKARERKRLDIDNEIAAIVVHEPAIRGLNVKAIYALRTGTRQIAGQTSAFGKPMLVYGGESYDIELQQPAGPTSLKSKVTPSRGSLTEIR